MICFRFLANNLADIFKKDWKLMVSIFYVFVTINIGSFNTELGPDGDSHFEI
jgi:hypothetical protein